MQNTTLMCCSWCGNCKKKRAEGRAAELKSHLNINELKRTVTKAEREAVALRRAGELAKAQNDRAWGLADGAKAGIADLKSERLSLLLSLGDDAQPTSSSSSVASGIKPGVATTSLTTREMKLILQQKDTTEATPERPAILSTITSSPRLLRDCALSQDHLDDILVRTRSLSVRMGRERSLREQMRDGDAAIETLTAYLFGNGPAKLAALQGRAEERRSRARECLRVALSAAEETRRHVKHLRASAGSKESEYRELLERYGKLVVREHASERRSSGDAATKKRNAVQSVGFSLEDALAGREEWQNQFQEGCAELSVSDFMGLKEVAGVSLLVGFGTSTSRDVHM